MVPPCVKANRVAAFSGDGPDPTMNAPPATMLFGARAANFTRVGRELGNGRTTPPNGCPDPPESSRERLPSDEVVSVRMYAAFVVQPSSLDASKFSRNTGTGAGPNNALRRAKPAKFVIVTPAAFFARTVTSKGWPAIFAPGSWLISK